MASAASNEEKVKSEKLPDPSFFVEIINKAQPKHSLLFKEIMKHKEELFIKALKNSQKRPAKKKLKKQQPSPRMKRTLPFASSSTVLKASGSLPGPSKPSLKSGSTLKEVTSKQEIHTTKEAVPLINKEDPPSKQEDPPSKQEDLLSKQEDPSSKKEDRPSKQEDPLSKQKDPLSKQEDHLLDETDIPLRVGTPPSVLLPPNQTKQKFASPKNVKTPAKKGGHSSKKADPRTKQRVRLTNREMLILANLGIIQLKPTRANPQKPKDPHQETLKKLGLLSLKKPITPIPPGFVPRKQKEKLPAIKHEILSLKQTSIRHEATPAKQQKIPVIKKEATAPKQRVPTTKQDMTPSKQVSSILKLGLLSLKEAILPTCPPPPREKVPVNKRLAPPSLKTKTPTVKKQENVPSKTRVSVKQQEKTPSKQEAPLLKTRISVKKQDRTSLKERPAMTKTDVAPLKLENTLSKLGLLSLKEAIFPTRPPPPRAKVSLNRRRVSPPKESVSTIKQEVAPSKQKDASRPGNALSKLGFFSFLPSQQKHPSPPPPSTPPPLPPSRKQEITQTKKETSIGKQEGFLKKLGIRPVKVENLARKEEFVPLNVERISSAKSDESCNEFGLFNAKSCEFYLKKYATDISGVSSGPI